MFLMQRGNEMPARLFPFFLKLQDRPCLVVGAGAAAESKIASLLDAGAQVTVVAPAAGRRVTRFVAERKVRWLRRQFQPADLAGVFLVISATSDPAVSRSVSDEARSRGVLCNAVDEPALCDFYFPAVVRRGDLQIAISTSGQSPALARRIRCELEEAIDRSMGVELRRAGALRRRILAFDPPSAARSRLLRQLACRDVCDLDQCPARALTREEKQPSSGCEEE